MEADMTKYQLDTAADQTVHRVMDELKSGRQPLEVLATREYSAETGIDLEESDVRQEAELASLTTIGVLEVTPMGEENGWLLRVRVEDTLGPIRLRRNRFPAFQRKSIWKISSTSSSPRTGAQSTSLLKLRLGRRNSVSIGFSPIWFAIGMRD